MALRNNPMAPSAGVKLGELGSVVCAHARWLEEDEYPGHQVWANELEDLCEFLVARGAFERFLPRLKHQKAQHRNTTLGEIRAVYVLDHAGFKITMWEPEAVPGRPG